MVNDPYVRRNPDGSITVGFPVREVTKALKEEIPVEETEEVKPAPKKGGRPKKK